MSGSNSVVIAQADARQQIWWLNPWIVACTCIIPAYVLGYLAPNWLGPETLLVRFRIYFDAKYFWMGLAFLVMFAGWACLVEKSQLGYPARRKREILVIKEAYLDGLALATFAAYGLWFHGLLVHPQDLVNILKGTADAVYELRLNYRTVSGVTTASQFGVAYAAIYAHRLWIAGLPFAHRRYRWYLIGIVGLAAFRAYGWAERLALVEVALPIVIVYLSYRVSLTSGWRRAAVFLAPIGGVVLLMLYFGTSEFLRSWATHYRTQHIGFLEFVSSRLLTYYYTALNNGAALLANRDWPSWEFQYLLHWLHRFPLLVGALFRYLIGYRGQGAFLEMYGDAEFNNMSGIFTVFYDVGTAGAMLFAAVWGGFMGWAYAGFRRGRGLGAILYPVCFISILEVMRILYICESRAAPFLVAICIGYVFFTRPVSGEQDPRRNIETVRIRRSWRSRAWI